MPHAQSTIALYTKLDAECDQQAMIVGRLLTTLGHVRRRQVLSTTDQPAAPLARGVMSHYHRLMQKSCIIVARYLHVQATLNAVF